MMLTPLVALPTDVKELDDYSWHATPEQYLAAAIRVSRVLPVQVPAFGGEIDLDSLFAKIDGVLITGARSNVHPSLYGVEPEERYEPFDPRRDATSLPLIRTAVEKGVPLLAICRGIQELNVALGGTLATEIQERDGIDDHRGHGRTPDEKFRLRHAVSVRPGSCLAEILGAGEIEVNSVHRQGIDRLSPRLQVEAVAQDGTVEAVSVIDAPGFAVGVQWHPEYLVATDNNSRLIFEAFGEAVRKHAAKRA